jgi:hypothetical protein
MDSNPQEKALTQSAGLEKQDDQGCEARLDEPQPAFRLLPTAFRPLRSAFCLPPPPPPSANCLLPTAFCYTREAFLLTNQEHKQA